MSKKKLSVQQSVKEKTEEIVEEKDIAEEGLTEEMLDEGPTEEMFVEEPSDQEKKPEETPEDGEKTEPTDEMVFEEAAGATTRPEGGETEPTEEMLDEGPTEETPEDGEETPEKEGKGDKPEKDSEENKPEPKPLKKKITLSDKYEVRYHAIYSNKRLAVKREMSLFNILYAYVHNRNVFIGFCDKSVLPALFEYINNTPINIEGVKISDDAKKNIIIRIRMSTDYVELKWRD